MIHETRYESDYPDGAWDDVELGAAPAKVYWVVCSCNWKSEKVYAGPGRDKITYHRDGSFESGTLEVLALRHKVSALESELADLEFGSEAAEVRKRMNESGKRVVEGLKQLSRRIEKIERAEKKRRGYPRSG